MKLDKKKLEADKLYFLPLGGCGEIGMNLNAYCYNNKWLLVDCGITFGDPTLPGVDVMTPDPQFLEDRQDDIIGLIATHAHEDHIGAIPYIWPRLKCPVYGTPFTMEVLQAKLDQTSFGKQVEMHTLPLEGQVKLGDFTVDFLSLTHSIPESSALVINTPVGDIVHTGDWKLDDEPMLGQPIDQAAFKALAKKKPLAMVCDSTNVLVPGRTGSEGDVAKNLAKVIAETKGKIIVTCFASNVARLQSIAEAAEANGRAVVLLGRSLWRMTDAAKKTGYLKKIAPFLGEKEAEGVPDENLLYICTGSQGEPRAALHRIATGKHPGLSISTGDTVVFSSRVIPGNERSVGRIKNWLAVRGAKLITEKDAMIHVSGHPAKDELRDMYKWVQPNCLIPVHGEARHMIAQSELAKEAGIPETLVMGNGGLAEISKDGAKLIDEVQAGRLMVAGDRLLTLDSPVRREFMQTMEHGHAFVTLCLEDDGELAAPVEFSTISLLEDDEVEHLLPKLDRTIEEELDKMNDADDNAIEQMTFRTTRRLIKQLCGRKPRVTVHIVRLLPLED